MNKQFLHVKNGKIVDQRDQPIFLRGVNVGGWLMKEAYILHAPHSSEKKFKKEFVTKLGERAWDEFNHEFRNTFIRESDFKIIKSWGCNCIRVPFHYGLVEKKPFVYDEEGLKYLDTVLRWATKHKIYVILDMHAVPGSQNHEWHSDSDGEVEFWIVKEYQRRACALWTFIANRYQNEKFLAGYDVLNETVWHDAGALNHYYHEAIKAIRSGDQNHILFIEGDRFATNLDVLDNFNDHNYALSVHTYEPMDVTFNLVPLAKYPGPVQGYERNRATLTKHLGHYAAIAKKRNLPVYVGEFGVNFRNCACGEDVWLKDNLELFNKFGFHWAYWTFKAVKNFSFPDGIYSYYPNSPWVNRMGPVTGWNTYADKWPTLKKEMIASWKTEKFTLNTTIADLIKKYAKS